MIKILDKDLAFALQIADEVAIVCSRVLECFFNGENEKCPVDWHNYLYTSLDIKHAKEMGGSTIIINELTGSQIEEQTRTLENCPILALRDQIKNESPLLFGQFKKICEEVELEYSRHLKAQAEKRHFFAKFLLGFLAIYSANGYCVPFVTKDIFQKLTGHGINEEMFCKTIEEELKNLNPQLYKILLQRLKNCEYSPQRRRRLFALLGALIQGFKQEHKELFDEVERILRESREDKAQGPN